MLSNWFPLCFAPGLQSSMLSTCSVPQTQRSMGQLITLVREAGHWTQDSEFQGLAQIHQSGCKDQSLLFHMDSKAVVVWKKRSEAVFSEQEDASSRLIPTCQHPFSRQECRISLKVWRAAGLSAPRHSPTCFALHPAGNLAFNCITTDMRPWCTPWIHPWGVPKFLV